MTEPAMLEVRNLQKRFGNHEVLKDINLSVTKGEVLSIIGRSGSGKSTLLRGLNLLEPPTSGEILFHGQNILADNFDLIQYRTKVGWCSKTSTCSTTSPYWTTWLYPR